MKEFSYGIAPYFINDYNEIYLLVSKSSFVSEMGFIKGKIEHSETIIDTALREFLEESYLDLNIKFLEKYFFQKSKRKDIGIFLYNIKNLHNFKFYFDKNLNLMNFEKKELYSVFFIKISDLNLNNFNKNQQKIMNNIILEFSLNRKNYIISNKFFL